MKIIGEKLNVKGDIIITDPCYFIKEGDDWQLYCKAWGSNENEALKQFSISPSIIIESDEINCEVYDDKGNAIGKFCSDSAHVCVCLLEDVLEYNPDYNDFNKENVKNSVTIIRDFNGEVEVHEVSEEENKYCDFSITGKGKINFYTK
jgi:hypothetical protein